MELLLSLGADVASRDRHEMTPLLHACLGGHHDIVEKLLEADSIVDSADTNGSTGLFFAASHGHLDTWYDIYSLFLSCLGAK